jgi:hypothetical protein
MFNAYMMKSNEKIPKLITCQSSLFALFFFTPVFVFAHTEESDLPCSANLMKCYQVAGLVCNRLGYITLFQD